MWTPVNVNNLYLSAGWINWESILNLPYPFIVAVGGRGGGKTYGSLLWALQHNVRIFYVRRTQKQLKMIMKDKFQPYKKINADTGRNIQPQTEGDDLGSFHDKDRHEVVGYMGALSTISNIRGFDGSDVGMIIFDEFIPEPSERILFNQAEAIYNAHETINRNRELEGKDPVRLLMLSNANSIYGDIISDLRIGSLLYEMQKNKVELMGDKDRGLLVFLPQAPEFREQKSKTALYKLTAGSAFSDMALDNNFMIQDERQIRKKPVREYRPVAEINDVVICRHKSKSEFYVTTEKTGGVNHYDMTKTDIKRYIRDHSSVAFADQKKRVFFQDLDCQARFYQIYS